MTTDNFCEKLVTPKLKCWSVVELMRFLYLTWEPTKTTETGHVTIAIGLVKKLSDINTITYGVIESNLKEKIRPIVAQY